MSIGGSPVALTVKLRPLQWCGEIHCGPIGAKGRDNRVSQIRLTVRDGRPAPRSCDSVCPTAIPYTDAYRDLHATDTPHNRDRHSGTCAQAFGDSVTDPYTNTASPHALACTCYGNDDLAVSGHSAPG